MALKGFYGTYEITCDDKGRVRVPAKFKSLMGEEFVIAFGEKPCVSVYTEETFEQFTEQVDQLDALDEDAAEFRRTLYANVNVGEFDTAGRILIPVKYREYASLKKELVAAGVGDHFEIWDAEKWTKGDYTSLSKRHELQKGISQKISGGKN